MASIKEIQDALIRSIKAVETENDAARAASRIIHGTADIDIDVEIEPDVTTTSRA